MVCFQTKKSQIWVNFGGPLNGKCWYILRPFGIVCCHLLYFSQFWMLGPRKICQPCSKATNKNLGNRTDDVTNQRPVLKNTELRHSSKF
jgi:hypothetical protein